MRYHEDNLRESSPRFNQELETKITPEHSAETLRMVEQIDDRIADSESLLGGLGRIAREQIITDPEALEEIYAPQKIGKIDLEKHDASAFESASKGLIIRNAIKKVIFLRFAGSKHALRGYEGELVDKRKLKENAHGRQSLRYSSEFEDAIEKFGLDPEQSHSWQDFKKEYVEGEKGAEKIILKQKTEQEMNKTAGDILEKQLKNLETNTGTELVKQKENLEEFKKEIEQHKNVLSSEHLTKADNEYLARKELIGEKQEGLNSDLEIIRSPLLEQRENLTQTLENFSSLLKETDGQEKTYLDKIKDLQNKITKISGTKQLKEVLGDEIKEWEQEKKQAEVNLKDFKEKKQALNKRIIELKKSQTEVDATLTRINNIGKTKEELRAEKAEKLQEEKEKKEAPEAEKKNNANPAPIIVPVASAESGGDGDGEAVEVAGKTETRPAASQPVEKKSKTKAKKPKAEATPAVMVTPEQEKATAGQKSKENIKASVNEWLAILKLKVQQVAGTSTYAIKNNFVVGDKKFDETAAMTLAQARKAYEGYILQFQYSNNPANKTKAKKEAEEEFEGIIKDLE